MKHLTVDDRFNHIPIETVDFACSQAELRLTSQMQHIDGIRSNCTTAIGWISAVLVALIGAVIAVITADITLASLIPLTFGIAVSCTSLYLLIRHTLYKKAYHLPGDEPADIITDQTVQWLKNMEDGERNRASKAYWLARQQEVINANKTEIAHRVKWYRISLKAALYGYAITGLLALIAALV